MPFDPRTVIVRWEDPPPKTSNNKRHPQTKNRSYSAIAALLVSRPGEWALVAEGLSASAHGGFIGTLHRYGCETTARSAHRSDRLIDLWARYVDPADDGEK